MADQPTVDHQAGRRLPRDVMSDPALIIHLDDGDILPPQRPQHLAHEEL